MQIQSLSQRVGAGVFYIFSATSTTMYAQELPAVTVSGRHYDNAIGSSDAASQGTIRAELLESRPILRPGEVLEAIPGMVVTQHSGDGKANQYFLRGFNLDHGTDFATTVDGMPVNMPTHAHGQGFSDLNFLIPELVERIEYRKGPYFATHGDFATAGTADIAYKTRLNAPNDAPFLQLTMGKNGYQRALGAMNFDIGSDKTLLGAVEWMGNDGPWTTPEALRRRNAVLRWSQGNRAEGGSISLMAYNAQWNATDQIPQRLIEAGTYQGKPFSRFDSLDASDGGNTSRYSVSGQWHRNAENSQFKASAYALQYDLQLFSNFTYALERPDTGDQFLQQDKRQVVGFQTSQAWQHLWDGKEINTEMGFQLRHDRIQVGLYDTQQRKIITTTREDRIHQTQIGAYLQSGVEWTPWLRTVMGVRLDQMQPSAHNLVSPKFTLVVTPWEKTEFFFNAGQGFHSNDARGVLDKVAPVPALVAARGWELGVRTERIPHLQSSLAIWRLESDSELVYVGDVGATEASDGSIRRGIEFNNRWTPTPNLLVDADLAWTQARFSKGNYVPNAVDSVASIGVTLKNGKAWSASLQWRYLGSGALTEDNAVRSEPTSTFNLRLSRDMHDATGHRSTLTLDVFNLLNTPVNDIQYYYASRLPNESAPVDDKVIHPAEPFSIRLTYRMNF